MGRFNQGNRSDSGRDFRRRSFGDGGGRREMHHAVCSTCGKDCEVPFRPTGSKPVYCSECFQRNNGGNNSRRFQDRGSRRPSFEKRRSGPGPQDDNQFRAINRKLDKMLEMIVSLKREKEAQKKPKDMSIIVKDKAEIVKTKDKTSKKKTKSTKKLIPNTQN